MANVGSTTANRAYTIPILNAENYASWNMKLELLLIRSEIWGVVDGSDEAPPASDVAGLTAWKLRDAKARSELLLHCSEKQLLSLYSLKTSKQVWDRLKQLYGQSNKASKVNLHKQLCRLTMSDSDDTMSFLETWQSLLREAEIAGCTFTKDQQVNLLLGALPDSWSAFINTQGGIANLTFSTLLSNILQQNAINLSKPKISKSSAFYIKGKFIKPPFNNKFPFGHRSKTQNANFRSHHDKKRPSQKFLQYNIAPFNRDASSQPIVCHNCGIPGHKSPDCMKPKRNPNRHPKHHIHNYSSEQPHYLFLAIVNPSDYVSS